ncbi:MAG TPA: hypothetical protein VKS98_05460, partial [Chthoniobacterales bacterium]|nr:hypothetical protein [Chthoniobacterales bacterium]
MKITEVLSRGSIVVCGILFAASFAVIQMLIGGTRLLFSLPAYGILGAMAIIALLAIARPKPAPNQICLLSSAIF